MEILYKLERQTGVMNAVGIAVCVRERERERERERDRCHDVEYNWVGVRV